jgi:hypothetical protein
LKHALPVDVRGHRKRAVQIVEDRQKIKRLLFGDHRPFFLAVSVDPLAIVEKIRARSR